MLRFALVLFWLRVLPATYISPQTTGDGTRVVVDTHVTCGDNRQPALQFAIPLGTPLLHIQELKVDGKTWFLANPATSPDSQCRVYGPSTAVWRKADPDSLRLAVLNRILFRPDVTFDEFVEVDKYLEEVDPKWQSRAGSKPLSPLLQFRRLQLLSRALQTDGFLSQVEQPSVQAWLRSHAEFIQRFDPTGQWYVPPLYFWELFEANQTAPWAEELLWSLVNLPLITNGCDYACIVDENVIDRSLLYWTHFPAGPHLSEALNRAIGSIESVADEYPCLEDDLKRIDYIRFSLSKVMNPKKQLILRPLDAIHRKCGN